MNLMKSSEAKFAAERPLSRREFLRSASVVGAGIVLGTGVAGLAVACDGSTTTTAQVTVPDLVGLSQMDAIHQLESEGFNVIVQEEIDATLQPGTVRRQDPAAGQPVGVGSTVTLYVAAATTTTIVRSP